MRFKLWLEAINKPPYMSHLWWKETEAKAKKLESEISNKKDILKAAEEVAKDYSLSYPEDVYSHLPYNFKYMISPNENTYSAGLLSKRIEDLRNAQQIPNISTNVVKDYRNRVDFITQDKLDSKDRYGVRQFIDEYMKYQEEYKDDMARLERSADENELEQLKSIMSKAKAVLDNIYEYIRLGYHVKKTVDAWKEREMINAEKYYNGKEVRPKHDKFEILYHATPYVKEVMSQGFKLKKDLGSDFEALGGDTQDAISFTADIKIAKAIVSALKDAINIAQGKIGIGEVVKMLKGEKIPKSKYDGWLANMKGAQLKKQVQAGKKNAFWVNTKPTIYDDSRHQAFDLYKSYLVHSQLRYNPLFFGVTFENFMKLDPNNVGTIMCRCDMSKVVRYLEAMEEYRVTIDGIQILRSI